MASVAHVTSAALRRNQITAISQPKGLDRNFRGELKDSSRASQLSAHVDVTACEDDTTAGSVSGWTSLAQRVLVDFAVLHDDDKVLVGIGNKIEVLKRIAVDEQQIRKCTDFHDAELAGIGFDEARKGHQLAVVSGG